MFAGRCPARSVVRAQLSVRASRLAWARGCAARPGQGNTLFERTIVSEGFKGATRGSPLCRETSVSRTANVGT